MCELFGISSKKPIDARGYLKTFYSHSVRHPHGWGIMRYNDDNIEIIKESVRAVDSKIIDKTINETAPQTNMLAHIRLATVGSTRYENCHPYIGKDKSGRQWVLIHNGTIYSGTQLVKYLKTQTGDTDSERMFLYLLDEINNELEKSDGNLSIEKRCSIIEKFAKTLSPRNKLNFMIYDGELLYVHKNMADTLAYKKLGSGLVFSTSPLDSGNWAQLPMTQVLVFKDGGQIYAGASHKNEFIPTLEYITALDAMNI